MRILWRGKMNLPARIAILTDLIDQLEAVNKLRDQIAKAEFRQEAETGVSTSNSGRTSAPRCPQARR